MRFPFLSRFLAVWALVLWTGMAAVAATPPSSVRSSGPKDQAETFFDTVTQGDTAKAFDNLLDGSPISANKPEALSTLKQQLATGLRVYGKPLGFDLVDSKTFGTSLVRLVYIFKLEKYPLTFEFFFYRSGQTCVPIDVRFNDKLDVYRYDRVPAAGEESSSSPQS